MAEAAEDLPGWLEMLSFGDSRELRFPLVLMGVAILAFVTFLEALDGVARHLDHIVPFSLAITAALAFRWRLTRRYPTPLGPG